MKMRRLGTSDLEVTEISLGSWLTYSGGVEREQTEACTRAAFEAGINFFDTANAYGNGASERAWGEILGDYSRDEFILATKVYFPVDGGSGLSAEQIHKQIDASLERLQTDHIDLYQCHRFDVETPIEETMEALAAVVKAGKARWIGFSEWTPEQIEAGLDAAIDGVAFVSSQPQYSMLWRAPEDEVFPLCASRGISQVVWSPLAEGILSGKYEPGRPPPEDSRVANEPGARRRHARGRPGAAADRRGRRAHDGPARARLGPAPRRGRLSDHRRQSPRADPREHRRLRGRALAGHPRCDRRGARRRPGHRDDPRAGRARRRPSPGERGLAPPK
jgi:aryl-alcohol dehydrogenase-like predicted oxidoreductase